MANIRKRGRAYQIRVSAGYDIAGHQIIETMTWTPPEDWNDKKAMKEAEHQAIMFEEQIRNGLSASGNMRFAEFAEKWMKDYAEEQLRPRTVERYKELLEKINEEIGHLALSKIRPTHLLSFYSQLRETSANMACCCKFNLKAFSKSRGLKLLDISELSGVSYTTVLTANAGNYISAKCAAKICKALDVQPDALFRPREDRRLSPRTVQHYHRLISSILSDAVEWQYIPYNPCNRLNAPKVPERKIAYLDDDQARLLLQLIRKEPEIYQCAISLLLLTGLRRGELLGLEWRDIDFKNRTIFVCRTSQYISKKGIITDTTKNKTSTRYVCISETVAIALTKQLQWQQNQAKAHDLIWDENYRVITTEECIPMRPDRLTNWFRGFVSQSDLPPIHLHSLRHTYATLCIAKGVPLTAVAAQLGHANVATTATIYAHAIRAAQLAAADKMDSLFADIMDK